MVIPITMPRFLAVAMVPEAIPLRFCGTALITAELLAGIKIAIPIPARTNRQIIEEIDVDDDIFINERIADARIIIPMVQSIREPILS
mmetsp:Transcript_25001/g.11912  ORF Transcript_25001/g.11912 Transcript_25001/m.11912 type:complete len:88 (+) Transcript_25001:513-776(+)